MEIICKSTKWDFAHWLRHWQSKMMTALWHGGRDQLRGDSEGGARAWCLQGKEAGRRRRRCMSLLGTQGLWPRRQVRVSTAEAWRLPLPDSASLDDERQTGWHSGSPMTLSHTSDRVLWPLMLPPSRDILAPLMSQGRQKPDHLLGRFIKEESELSAMVPHGFLVLLSFEKKSMFSCCLFINC